MRFAVLAALLASCAVDAPAGSGQQQPKGRRPCEARRLA
jgi:hypothetical protein